MSRRDALRLSDIREAIATIRAHVADAAFDAKTSDAVLYNLVVIGEAVGQLSDETRARAPEVPWSRIRGLRNLITHQYFHVYLDIIKTIVADELDSLDHAAQRLGDLADSP